MIIHEMDIILSQFVPKTGCGILGELKMVKWF